MKIGYIIKNMKFKNFIHNMSDWSRRRRKDLRTPNKARKRVLFIDPYDLEKDQEEQAEKNRVKLPHPVKIIGR